MTHKDAPSETPVQTAVREFYTERLAKRGVVIAWGRDKHGRFLSEFARDAEAAWVAAQGESAKDSARLDWIESKGYAVRSRSNGHRNCIAWYGGDDDLRASLDRMIGSGAENA